MKEPRTLQQALEAGYELTYKLPNLKVGDTVEMRKAKPFIPMRGFIPSVQMELYDRLTVPIATRRELERLLPDFPA